MKKLNIFTTLMLLCGLVSCELDRLPETTLTENAFWKTESDFSGAASYLVYLTPGLNQDFRADEMIDSESSNSISNGSRTVPSTSSDWSTPYKSIYYSNTILYQASKCTTLSEETLKRYVAEARFYRAVNYFDLMKKYGGVPLLLTPTLSTKDTTITKGRATRLQVMEQILSDLDYAKNNLPDIDDATWGHPSVSAAQGMIVRACLYQGTYDKFHAGTARVTGEDYTRWLDLAIDTAEDIIESQEHDLYPSYGNTLFRFGGEGRQNRENIWVKVYGPYNYGGDASGVNYNNNLFGKFGNTRGLTRNIADMYLYKDGLPRSKSVYAKKQETSYDDMFVDRDPRLEQVLFKLGQMSYREGHVPFTTNRSTFSLGVKKYYDHAENQAEGDKCSVDHMLMRYAEILISYAEALYERDGSISDDVLDKTVNLLHERAGFDFRLTNAHVTANGLDMREEIRRERTVEFVHEMFRYDDLIRWKEAENALPKSLYGALYGDNDGNGVTRASVANRLTDAEGKCRDRRGRKVQICDQADVYVLEFSTDRVFDPGKDYLYPIPLDEITLSGHSVQDFQNPGWF